ARAARWRRFRAPHRPARRARPHAPRSAQGARPAASRDILPCWGPVMSPAVSRLSAVRRRLGMRLAAALLATAALLVAPTAALAGRSVPQGFFGLNWDQEVSYRTSLPTRAEQWGNMAAAGAEAVRKTVLWRSVQVWNEPSEYYQWSIPDGQDWGPGYGKLVRKSYKAIKDADPSVKVVLAGLPNTSPQYLDHLYKTGNIHGYFNVAAIHPYTAHKHGVLTLTKQFRAVMDKHGDKGKKLWVTELGLPASKGKTSDNGQLQTTDQGMADFLTESYNDLMQHRTSLKVNHVFFYTWASVYKGWIFKWTGLYVYNRHDGQDVFQEKPAYQAYVDVSRSREVG